jgi:hypothetical protein
MDIGMTVPLHFYRKTSVTVFMNQFADRLAFRSVSEPHTWKLIDGCKLNYRSITATWQELPMRITMRAIAALGDRRDF